MNQRLLLMFILMLLPWQPALAVQNVVVQALFPGKAVIMIDEQRRVLAVGETSPEGVTLIAADSRAATLEIEGERKEYAPGTAISLNFEAPEMLQEKLYANERGMFLTVGSINGQSVRFLVDTGATSVAMNKAQAKKLGVRYRIEGEPATASTASGFVRSYRVHLKSVTMGKIRRTNVEAMVIDGNHPGPILLGMSFLRGLKIDKSGDTLLLQQRK
jgi:aspartyl protease family protein